MPWLEHMTIEFFLLFAQTHIHTLSILNHDMPNTLKLNLSLKPVAIVVHCLLIFTFHGIDYVRFVNEIISDLQILWHNAGHFAIRLFVYFVGFRVGKSSAIKHY